LIPMAPIAGKNNLIHEKKTFGDYRHGISLFAKWVVAISDGNVRSIENL